MTILLAIWSFIKALPWQTYAVGAALLAIAIAVHSWDSHERDLGRAESAAQVAALQSQLDAAQQANATFDSTVAALKAAVADCERNRKADKDAQDEAQAAYAQALVVLKAGDAKAKAATQQRLATSCAAIAAQPSCVTAAP